MKRTVVLIVSVMLWVTALPTLAAPQQSIPNYVGQAPSDVHKYYPQYEAYFKTIFDKINTLKPHSIALLNEEIHEDMVLFEEDIKSEKDKRTIVLMALEMLIVGKKDFTKAKDVQGPQGDNDYKYEIAEDIEKYATERARKESEQSTKQLEETTMKLARVTAKNEKLKELIALINRVNDQGVNKDGMEQITTKIEEYFAQYNDEELKADLEQNQGIYKIIRNYINYNKQIGRTPSALGQKFINEYNRIIKQ